MKKEIRMIAAHTGEFVKMLWRKSLGKNIVYRYRVFGKVKRGLFDVEEYADEITAHNPDEAVALAVRGCRELGYDIVSSSWAAQRA